MQKIAAYKRLHCLALVVIILDQATKLLIENTLPLGSFYPPNRIEVIQGFFNLVHVGNTGAAWSMFSGYPKVLALIGLFALSALYFFRKSLELKLPHSQWVFGLIIGGIVGNLIDRFRLGHVTDFLDFHIGNSHWPSFNIADSGITIGVGLYILFSFLQPANPASEKGQSGKPE